jgi:hypothetical protein
MNVITKFELFCEARLGHLANIKGDDDLAKSLKDLQTAEFDLTKKLVKFITLSKRVNNKKVRFEINWNDTASHNLIKRISDRTSFGSVEEFNQYFKKEFCKIFPDMVGKELYLNGRYSLYSKEYNFTIIMYFNLDEYASEIYDVDIITILPGKKGENIVKFIDIY